ncbi:MAG: hypothetical protein U0L97_01640 [Candidatus Saccharimonadaceae bacterium]|nr:hypothetical protein [Candidatus Saccharimonadaceae bacterium]
MSEILTNNKYYKDIADTIRQMKGVATTYKPREMAGALREMYSTEVEGVPPLTFPSNGNNLLNYRIDGANGGVGDRTKNLLENTATTQTINGITVTVNDDKSISLSGTSSELTYIDINTNFNSSELAGYYLKLIFPENYVSATSRIIVRISSQNSRTSLQDFTTTKLINDNGNNNRLAIRINGNYTIPDNFKLYLMVSQNSNDNYEPYGKYKVPAIISGKNLLQNTATSQTISGVTFTINSDKSITCNGTATANTVFRTVQTPDLPDNEDMLFTGCPVGGSLSTYQLQYSNNRDKAFQDMGNGIVIQKMDYNTYPNTYVQIRIMGGYTCNNLTFYPMIRLATIEDDTYEPYHEPITTNIYLDEPIGANESKSLSDTNVNIPTINGTNILSIDTTVQPSNVYVQAPKTNNYKF